MTPEQVINLRDAAKVVVGIICRGDERILTNLSTMYEDLRDSVDELEGEEAVIRSAKLIEENNKMLKELTLNKQWYHLLCGTEPTMLDIKQLNKRIGQLENDKDRPVGAIEKELGKINKRIDEEHERLSRIDNQRFEYMYSNRRAIRVIQRGCNKMTIQDGIENKLQ